MRSTPGAGKRRQEHPGDRGQRARERPRPWPPTRLSRMPISEAVSPSSAAARIATPQSVQLERDHERRRRPRARRPPASTRAGGTRDVADVDDVGAPRGAERQHLGADPARELGEQHDVDAEREDRQRAAVGRRQAADQQDVDRARRRRAAATTPTSTAGQKPTVVAGVRDDVRARAAAIEPCAKLRRRVALKTITKPERDERVERSPSESPLSEQVEELVSHGCLLPGRPAAPRGRAGPRRACRRRSAGRSRAR